MLAEVYDPVADAWAAAPRLFVRGVSLTSLGNGSVLMAGGIFNEGRLEPATDAAYLFH